MHYLATAERQTDVFTDHKNLLHVFPPLALRPNSPRHVLSNVHPWAINLSKFDFHVNHIEVQSSVFAGILTRRSKGCRSRSAQVGSMEALYNDIVSALTSTGPITMVDLKDEQAKHAPPQEVTRDEEGIYQVKFEI